MELYFVGKHICKTDKGIVWEFFGVFDNEERALKICKDENYFISKIKVNDIAPEETVNFPDINYPLSQKGENK